jgi:hypothetical protein
MESNLPVVSSAACGEREGRLGRTKSMAYNGVEVEWDASKDAANQHEERCIAVEPIARGVAVVVGPSGTMTSYASSARGSQQRASERRT